MGIELNINVDIKKFYFYVIFSSTYEDTVLRTGDKVIVHEGFLNKEFHELLEHIIQQIKEGILLRRDLMDLDINKRTLGIEISISADCGNKTATAVFKGENGYLNYVTLEY